MTSLTSLPFVVHYRFLYIFEPILFLPFRPTVPYQGWQQPMVTYEGYLVYINRTKLRPQTVFLMKVTQVDGEEFAPNRKGDGAWFGAGKAPIGA